MDDSGSATTFYTDYHFTSHDLDAIYGARLGGAANDGALDGLAYLTSTSSPSASPALFGSRLVWQK